MTILTEMLSFKDEYSMASYPHRLVAEWGQACYTI